MKAFYKAFIIIFLSGLCNYAGVAQIVVPHHEHKLDVDSLKKNFENEPYFGLYKDNYFIFGTSIGPKPTRQNTNVKFQISVAQRLTRSTLPFGTYLYLFYTQKAFWNVIEKSMPFYDLNFNPGFGLAKPIYIGNSYIGKAMFVIEHESNGRDSIFSRSVNRISFSANIILDPNIMVYGKFSIPIIDSDNNRDIFRYTGPFQGGINLISNNRRLVGNIMLTKRGNWKLDFNTMIEFGYKISERSNQYLFIQYYNGYGEGLMDYKKFTSELRVGIVIRPRYFSDY